MMNWVKALSFTTESETQDEQPIEPAVTRQELADLFADDLARPALQKRAGLRFRKPRRLMAGRYLRSMKTLCTA